MSQTHQELRRSLNELRRLRAAYMASNPWTMFIPDDFSHEREDDLIKKIAKIEKDPPSAPGVVMLLADAVNSFESRLTTIEQKLQSAKKSVDNFDHSVKRPKHYWFLSCVIVLQISTLIFLLVK